MPEQAIAALLQLGVRILSSLIPALGFLSSGPLGWLANIGIKWLSGIIYAWVERIARFKSIEQNVAQDVAAARAAAQRLYDSSAQDREKAYEEFMATHRKLWSIDGLLRKNRR